MQADSADSVSNLYEEEFLRYLRIAEGFVKTLQNKTDRIICVRWIRKLCDLQSFDRMVKINRNAFFKYFLQVMQIAVMAETSQTDQQKIFLESFKHNNQLDLTTVENPTWLENELAASEMYVPKEIPNAPYLAHWSEDQRTYMAAKALPGEGALIYMAVSKDPSLGWDNLSGRQ